MDLFLPTISPLKVFININNCRLYNVLTFVRLCPHSKIKSSPYPSSKCKLCPCQILSRLIQEFRHKIVTNRGRVTDKIYFYFKYELGKGIRCMLLFSLISEYL